MDTQVIKLAVDAGHGLSNRTPGVYDPGALGHGREEADIALAYALTLAHVWRQAGGRVYCTRASRASHAPVGSRARLAVDHGCTHLISIHLNAHTSAGANGTEVLVADSASEPFAQRVLGATLHVVGLRDRGIKRRAGLAVLRFPGPACLIELGFITNARDIEAIAPRDPERARDIRLEWARAVTRALMR